MSSATIMCCDIVGFSKKSTADQRSLIDEITTSLAQELKLFLQPASGEPGLIALPTGDGLALTFLHVEDKGWDRSKLFEVILNLHKWAHSKSRASAQVSMRVGVHVGIVELIDDINGRRNVCGHTINFAQRVMDAANPRQTLFSEEAFAARTSRAHLIENPRDMMGQNATCEVHKIVHPAG